MRIICALVFASSIMFVGCVTAPKMRQEADLQMEVTQTERAFAETMKNRDHAAFVRFLSEEAVFFTEKGPLRGKEQVANWWKRLFEKPEAPFSWEPKTVEVLSSGNLALSTGPVFNPQGHLVSTFTSIWRREGPGVWRIIFDKGNEVCPETNR